jgi:hypothetical protein
MESYADQFGPHAEIIKSIYEIHPDVLEQLCQFIEQRGIRTPIGQVVGYRRDKFVTALHRSATQSIPDSTDTLVGYDTIDSDDQKAFDNGGTVTLPTDGSYIAVGRTTWASATGQRRAKIEQNGTEIALDWRSSPSVADTQDGTVVAVFVGSKGDTLELYVNQSSGGGALNIDAASFSVALLNSY